MHLGGKFWAQKGSGMGAGEARPLCFCRWSHPAPPSWNQGGAAAMGEEVGLGGGQTAQAVWPAEKFPESQRGLLGPHWGTDQTTGRSTQAARGKGAAVGLVGRLEEVLRAVLRLHLGLRRSGDIRVSAPRRELEPGRGRLSRGLEGPGRVQASRDWCSEGHRAGAGSTRKPLSYLLALNPEALLPILRTLSSQTRLLWTCLT